MNLLGHLRRELRATPWRPARAWRMARYVQAEQALADEVPGYHSLGALVCTTHRRFLCREPDETCCFSADPDDIQAVREWQRNNTWQPPRQQPRHSQLP